MGSSITKIFNLKQVIPLSQERKQQICLPFCSSNLQKKKKKTLYWTSAMVTSTSTPGSMLMLVICLTTSGGEYKSINLLCTLISNLSQVLVPSPQGDFLVVMRSFLVGSLTGPLTLSFLLLAPLIKSLQTF